MPYGRSRARLIASVVAVLAAAATLLTVGPGLPGASAEPDVASVQRQLASLDRQAEIAAERYNDARVKLDETQLRLAAVNADLREQRRIVGRLRDQVAAMVVDQYQSTNLSLTSRVVLSNDPDAFLDNLSAVSIFNDQRGEVMRQFATEMDRLALRQKAVTAEAKRISKLERKMRAEKRAIDKRVRQAQALLDRLQGAERRQVVQQASAGAYTGPLPDVPITGRGAAAVKYALAQVGKSYVYGAAGPNAFDCSGLTMMAWAQAGVSLPHSSGAQMGSGARVAESQLQPGDLVFYYSPVSHVGIYIGNGLIVNALNPRSGVRVSGLHSMPYAGAVRPG